MTLTDLLPQLPLSYAEGKTYGLVFADDLKARLDQIQQEHPSQHHASPVATTDARWLLCGDILSEVGPGGIFANGFQYLDPARFNEILVISWQDAVALLPVPEEII